jgi:hypothetical protein
LFSLLVLARRDEDALISQLINRPVAGIARLPDALASADLARLLALCIVIINSIADDAESHPAAATVLSYLGTALVLSEDPAGAESAVAQARELDPNVPWRTIVEAAAAAHPEHAAELGRLLENGE